MTELEPWAKHPKAMGRIRIDEEMARAMFWAIDNAIEVLWSYRETLPNPSDESYTTIRRIRTLEKARRNIIGTMEEKGWPIE